MFLIKRVVKKLKEEGIEYSVTEKQLQKILFSFFNYSILLKQLSAKHGNALLMEQIALLMLYNDNEIDEELLNNIKELDDLIIDDVNDTIIITGYYDNEFQYILLDDNIMEDLATIQEYIYKLVDDEGETIIGDITLPSELTKYFDLVLPKQRQRYKGLGANVNITQVKLF